MHLAQVLGAMGPPGGARNAVDPRFISLFSVFEVETPSADNLRAIFGAILGGHLAGMPVAVSGRAIGGWVCVCDRQPLPGSPLQRRPACGTARDLTAADDCKCKHAKSYPSHQPIQVREALGDGSSLTDATLELFSHIVERLPPTPSRFHYVFNLRDLSRVYEGLLRATPER